MAKGKGNIGKMPTPKGRGGAVKGGGKPMVTPKQRGDSRSGGTPKGRGKGS
jgi:hypothetical protein